MRFKAALTIIVIAFVITAINFGSSIILTGNTLNATMSEDISLARDIANDFVSTRIGLYKSNAQTAAVRLMKTDSPESMEVVMRELLDEFRDFMAFTVFDRQGIIAEFGDSPTSIKYLDYSKYIEKAFEGNTVISTTRYNEASGKLVMHIVTPMDIERILSVTISGMILSELLGDYILRDTRSIFMLDEYGTVIAHFQPELVTSRTNIINANTFLNSQSYANFFNEMLMYDKGQGNYFNNGIEYQCAYAKVSASETGWYIGLSVPRKENLIEKLQKRLLVLAVFFFIVGVIAAVISSRHIVKPYNKISQQNNLLEELMEETRRLQTELEAALKEAQEANHAKSSFLANVSHEMRTPLNAVIGLSELILNTGTIHGDAEDKLNKIYNSGMTLLSIVNDILDISKIESGRFDLYPVKYNTSSLINDIVSLNIVRIGEKPIKFILTVDENLPEQISGDDLRIKQIFNNLLSNAFKYTNSGTVEWNVSFERDGDNIWLISYVKDTGVGIKNDDLPKLFKEYIQVNAQAFRKTESTGLGLSITKHLVEMMDGTITAESEYGKGMIFSVRLRQQFISDVPIGRETARNIMSAQFNDNKRERSIRLKRIDLSYASVLVVDDIQANLDVARGMLIPYGLYVDCASSGQEAVNMIHRENPRYDAVFMDHMMPGMDGIEAVRIIHKEIGNDYAKNVPVIVMTANAITGSEQMFLKNGFQAFISKPIDMIRLDAILRRWVAVKSVPAKKDFKNTAGTGSGNEIINRFYIQDNNNIYAKDGRSAHGGITIDGIDMEAGLEGFLGDEEMYFKVLKSYAVNTRPLLGITGKYLESGNLADYAVTVHGIKGSSFSIGAMQAGTHAQKLELLAKKQKTKKVLSENRAFVKYMENLLDSIEAGLAIIDRKNAKPVAASPDPELLHELREACVEYNVGKVDQVMEKLDSFKYKNGTELVTWLHRQVDEMSFSSISDGDWPVFSDYNINADVTRHERG
ncbi:MAG: ATP-binding protein [Treponema sp.]|nr:ATP-binding protein [Treponema sp.]